MPTSLTPQGGDYGNALQAACAEGHSATVKLLLSKGANINVTRRTLWQRAPGGMHLRSHYCYC